MRNDRRSSLRARILAAFLLAFAASVGTTASALLQLRAIGDGLGVLEVGYLPLARVAAQLEALQTRIDIDTSYLSGQRGPMPMLDLGEATEDNARRIDLLLDEGSLIVAEALPRTHAPEEIAVLISLDGQLTLIAQAHEAHAAVTSAYLGLLEVGAAERAEELEPDLIEAQLQLQAEIAQLADRVDDSILRVSARTSAIQNRALLLNAALSLAALIFGLVMLGLAGLSLRPIGRLTREVQRIARGDYAARVEVGRRDELGLLAEEVNAMAQSIELRDEALRTRAVELEQARSRLRSVLDAIHLGLVVVRGGSDEGDTVEMCNPAAATMWGVEPGRPLPPALRGSEGRAEALHIGGRTYDLARVPFGGGFILAGEDVTRRLLDRERLARSERLALVGQMLAQITHEVRNPLNAMSLNAELLDEELALLPAEHRAEAREMLETLTSEITRLEAVTEHYLDLARRPSPSIEPQDLAAVVAEVIRLLDEELRRGGVALTLEADNVGEVPADGNQLRQALLNVVRNASEAGARRIAVSLWRDPWGVHIAVADDGPGMDPETAARALDPFFSTRARGTGLGLAITRQILEDHGGSIRIERPERGTRVILGLPAPTS